MKTLWKSTWRYRRDLQNVLSYGLGAPKSCQLMYCRPNDVLHHSTYVDLLLPDHCATIPKRFAKHPNVLKEKMMQVVAAGDWDQHHMPFSDVQIYKLTFEKLATGQSWEEVGEFARMEELIRIKGGSDGCKNRADIEQRYARMDALVEDIRRERQLKTRKELGDVRFREMGGINIAIGRDGTFIKLQGGTHRLAIAAYFDLPAVPVCLHIVHKECVLNGRFKELMTLSKKYASDIETERSAKR